MCLCMYIWMYEHEYIKAALLELLDLVGGHTYAFSFFITI